MTKKTTRRLKREQEIEEALEAGDECFERLKKNNGKNPKPEGLKLAHHKRTKTLFQALKEENLFLNVNVNG